VWEIGAGWGGLAYQFKTICPNATYLITAPPSQLLLSAVYLSTMFPTARCRFFEPRRPDAFLQNWETVDFAFAPDGAVAALCPPGLELTLDVTALERMTAERAALHVKRAFELGSRHFLSVGEAQTSDTSTPTAVRECLDRFYWPHPVSAPMYVAKRLGIRSVVKGSAPPRYFLGWKRLRV
jgi:hypothetical protein